MLTKYWIMYLSPSRQRKALKGRTGSSYGDNVYIVIEHLLIEKGNVVLKYIDYILKN